MKRYSKFLALTAMSVGLIACGSADDGINVNSGGTSYHEVNVKANVQGTIFDAVTGERVAKDKNLKVEFIVAGDYREASVQQDDGRVSDYSITDLPASVNGANTVIRMRVSADGYHTRDAQITLRLECTQAGSADKTCSNGLIDDVMDEIANVNLWPKSVKPADVKVRVTYKGATVVPDGTLVYLKATNNGTYFNDYDARYISVAPVALKGGVAVFSGDKLGLGMTYQAAVYPLSILGTTTQPGSVNVNVGVINGGQSGVVYSLDLTDAVTSANQEGLYITTSSHEDENKIDSNGTLTVVLSRDVEMVSPQNLTFGANAVTNSTATATGATIVAATLDGNKVSVGLSGKTLKMQPFWVTNKAPGNATYKTVKVKHNYLDQIILKVKGRNITYTLSQLTAPDGTTYGNNKTVVARQQ